MSPSFFDLVIRNARVATASDVFQSSLAVTDGKVVPLGEYLPKGREEIDAHGRVLTPRGGVHCHLGNTTVIPFAAHVKGQSLRAAVEDCRQRAEGRGHVDYALHMIVSEDVARRRGAVPAENAEYSDTTCRRSERCA